MLTVNISKEDYIRLKNESAKNHSGTVRKRCMILIAKLNNPELSCQKIANILSCCRNLVMKTIHTYNKEGIDTVLKMAPKPGRPGKCKEQMESIDSTLEDKEPHTIADVKYILETLFGIKLCRSSVRYLLRKLGFKRRKLRPLPGKVDPEKQKKWIEALQPIIKEAKEGKRMLYFSDAVHFTLDNFSCYVWSKRPKYLRTSTGRNRYNYVGAIDPVTLKLIGLHCEKYVNAEQIMLFLEKVRQASGNLPVSMVLDNARYQHCQAVMDKAKELNIDLIFLPPYSPNLNIIERLWRYVRAHVLAGKYFPTKDEFHEALRYFFEDDFHNHKSKLKSLLTLKFQSFDNAQLLCA